MRHCVIWESLTSNCSREKLAVIVSQENLDAKFFETHKVILQFTYDALDFNTALEQIQV